LVCGLLSNEINAGCKSILEDRDPEPNPATKALIKSIRPLFESELWVEIRKGRTTMFLSDHHWAFDNAEPAGLILEITDAQLFDNVKAKNYFMEANFRSRLSLQYTSKKTWYWNISVQKCNQGNRQGGSTLAMQLVMEQKQIETDRGTVEGYLAIPLDRGGSGNVVHGSRSRSGSPDPLRSYRVHR
jgi:hypothetical protein